MTNFFYKNKIHLLFLFLLSLNYFFPLLIFGKITLFYHDALDGEVVYNSIIGKILGGNIESIGVFLNEEIKAIFLRRLFQPFSIFYYFFQTETAYWIIDIIVKLVSYFSFYVLSKKINHKKFESGIAACLFACINLRSQDGFGIAITPYIIYLIAFKKNFTLKHYFLILLSGLNTDFATCIPQFPAIILASYILNKNKIKKFILNSCLILGIFILFTLISNMNLIYAQITDGNFHRNSFDRETLPFITNFFVFIKDIIFLPDSYDWRLFRFFPQFLIFSLILIFIFFNNQKKIFQTTILIFLINSIPFFIRVEAINTLRNSYNGLIKTFHFEYIAWATPLLFLIILSLLFKLSNKYLKYLKFVSLVSIFFFQINSSIVPLGKKYFFAEKNYRNLYTFEGYYMYDDYLKIKNIVNNDRVVSVGYDPMIAAMNGINVIDGYHTIYPSSYKIKFRKIIEKELNKEPKIKKYYDNWGSRVYAFVSDPKNIELNFLEAKKIGAKYIISRYPIPYENLNLISKNFKNKIFLYEIN
jgi:hypothetical protein